MDSDCISLRFSVLSGTIGINPLYIVSNLCWSLFDEELEILISGSLIKLFKRLFSSSSWLDVDCCWLWTISPNSRLYSLVRLERLGSEKLFGLSFPILSINAVSAFVITSEIDGWLRVWLSLLIWESLYWWPDWLSLPWVKLLVLRTETFALALWRF